MSGSFTKLFLFVALVGLVACGDAERVSSDFKARLDSVLDTKSKEPTSDEVRDALVRQLRVPTGGAAVFPSRDAIAGFYAKHGNRLVWSGEGGRISAGTAVLLDALRRAGEQGLDPADYEADRLFALEKDIRDRPKDERAAQRLADFDLLATTAFFRYASDLSTGRVHPNEVQQDWHTNAPEVDVAAALEEAVGRTDLPGLLASLPPPHPGYTRLREALGALREIDAAGGWPLVPPGAKLGPRSTGPRVEALRQRLAQPPGSTFDSGLTGAVKRYQSLVGLEPRGVVDDETLAALNVSVVDRIRQVELNLERWRWIPRQLGNPHVLVNIPAFELELAREGSAPWRTRVVAGKAFTPTPILSDRIVAFVVNPPWNVPESIAVNEYLPELKKNPQTLARQGVKLLEGSGDKAREIDPGSVNWAKVDPEKFPYRLRQDPGDKNPLGRIKFDLTNDLSIYLHDTPAGGVFDRADRDVSHGCIRVKDALVLADFLASEPVKEKLHEALEQRDEDRRIELDPAVPVHILYFTAWVDDAGSLHFGPDIYSFDQPQWAAVQKASGRP
jgi:murein L,D-transpeptidase YcbB/YkuD